MLNVAFWRYLKRFGTAEKMLNTRSLKRPFWHYLKQYFRSAEKNSKTRIVNSALWWYLKRFGTAEKMLKTRSLKHAKFWHYLKQPFGNAENILKTRLLSQAFWHYLKRYFVTAKIFFLYHFIKRLVFISLLLLSAMTAWHHMYPRPYIYIVIRNSLRMLVPFWNTWYKVCILTWQTQEILFVW